MKMFSFLWLFLSCPLLEKICRKNAFLKCVANYSSCYKAGALFFKQMFFQIAACSFSGICYLEKKRWE